MNPDSLGDGSNDGDSGDGDSRNDAGDDGESDEDSDDENFEVVTVPAGETDIRRVEDGETLENVLFDISAPESRVDIDCRGDGWTLRNVGIRGTSTYPGKEQVIHARCDGDGLIENVYLGDGSETGCHDTGIFVDRRSEGRLTIRNVNVQDWVDNGIYASAPGHARKSHGGCEVVIEDSYGRNNNTANFRIGSDGSVVRGCVSLADGSVPAKTGSDGETKRNCRPVWVTEGGDCAVENCDLVATHEHASYCVVESEREVGGTVRVTDCRLTTRERRWRTKLGEIRPEDVSYPDEGEAATAVPEGVPTTPEEAASARRRNAKASDRSTTDRSCSQVVRRIETERRGDVEQPGTALCFRQPDVLRRVRESIARFRVGVAVRHQLAAGSGDVRAGHRRPAERVVAADDRRFDVTAGCGEFDLGAGARKTREGVGLGGGAHGDHRRISGGIPDAVRTRTVVARCGDEQDALVGGVLAGVLDRL